MTDAGFLRIMAEAFQPFLMRLGFQPEKPEISGRFYMSSFTGRMHAVSIYYEPGEERLPVVIFTRKDGELSEIDDHSQTPRLTDLNMRYMKSVTPDERTAAGDAFGSIVATDETERKLLQCAKELSLVLPKYLADQGVIP